MKRAIYALAVLIAGVTPAAASAATRTVVGCQDNAIAGGVEWLVPQVAPDTCTLVFHQTYSPYIPASDLGTISGTHWFDWGRATATGKGWAKIRGQTYPVQATMRAWRIEVFGSHGPHCSKPVRYYSRVTVTEGKNSYTFMATRPTFQC